MFRRLDDDREPVTIVVEGQDYLVSSSDSVAAALLASGIEVFRSSTVTNASRAPFCMMGICNDCLVEIDGQPNRLACLTPVRDGLEVRLQFGEAVKS